MLKDAEKEFTEIDVANATQVDPFARDKVMKIESGSVTKRSTENIKYGDDLIYAIEMSEKFREEVEQYAIGLELYEAKKGPEPERPRPSIHFLGRTIYDHILLKLKQIRAADLESTLKFLNYTHSCALLFYAEHYLRNVSLQDFLLVYRTLKLIWRHGFHRSFSSRTRCRSSKTRICTSCFSRCMCT